MNKGYRSYTLSGCPCQGCGERHEACHGECARYRAWSEANGRAREARTREHVLAGYAREASERVRDGTHQAFVRRRK